MLAPPWEDPEDEGMPDPEPQSDNFVIPEHTIGEVARAPDFTGTGGHVLRVPDQGQVDMRKKNDRYAAQRVVGHLIPHLNKKNSTVVRTIEYTIGQGTWKLRHDGSHSVAARGKTAHAAHQDMPGMSYGMSSTPGGGDEAVPNIPRITFTGLTGKHTFKANKSVETEVSLESFRIDNITPPSNLPEGWDSSSDGASVILNSPQSREPQKCTNCFLNYLPEENPGIIYDDDDDEDPDRPTRGCWSHSHDFGKPGVYENHHFQGQWSCCQSTDQMAKPCRETHHTSKYRMVHVRANSTQAVCARLPTR